MLMEHVTKPVQRKIASAHRVHPGKNGTLCFVVSICKFMAGIKPYSNTILRMHLSIASLDEAPILPAKDASSSYCQNEIDDSAKDNKNVYIPFRCLQNFRNAF